MAYVSDLSPSVVSDSPCHVMSMSTFQFEWLHLPQLVPNALVTVLESQKVAFKKHTTIIYSAI